MRSEKRSIPIEHLVNLNPCLIEAYVRFTDCKSGLDALDVLENIRPIDLAEFAAEVGQRDYFKPAAVRMAFQAAGGERMLKQLGYRQTNVLFDRFYPITIAQENRYRAATLV